MCRSKVQQFAAELVDPGVDLQNELVGLDDLHAGGDQVKRQQRASAMAASDGRARCY
jgi:hypothetical protein